MRLAVLSLITLGVTMGAAEARTSWEGRVITTALNQTCIDEGDTIGSAYLSTFMPSDITDNGPDSHISFYGGRNAFAVRTAGRPAAGKNYNAIYINSYGKYVLLPNPTGQITTYTATATPAPLSASTEYINLTITITNWAATTGCTATLKGGFIRRR